MDAAVLFLNFFLIKSCFYKSFANVCFEVKWNHSFWHFSNNVYLKQMRCIQQLVLPSGNIFIRLTAIKLLIWLILFSKSNVHFTWMALIIEINKLFRRKTSKNTVTIHWSASKFNGFLPDSYCIFSPSFVEICPAGFCLILLTSRRKHNLSIPNMNTPRMSNHRMRRSETIWKGLNLRAISPDVMGAGWVGSCLSMRSQLKGRWKGFCSRRTT